MPSKTTQYLLRSQQAPVALRNIRTDSNDNSTVAALAAKKKAESSKRPTKRVEAVVLQEADIEERHVRGWGNGGQKLNKTSSCVQLLHKPTNTTVVCQDTRSLQQNRKIAYKRLKEKLDLQINGSQSKIGKKIEKLRARKHKQRQRAKKKYQQQQQQNHEEPLDSSEEPVE
ncbi:hypothetical protein H4R20_002009 [Coemansia guatemalensis]|uniref:Prokaryotic-type class I peptide chain release factors domain-containing protein n=1 Tax=Coemansia guatemalensis TaxID=2761395 RepID=A0A9W8LV40_9FUNG|nr:hypothetical protein H4R20_002009 [Coemansia guatemalensis]